MTCVDIFLWPQLLMPLGAIAMGACVPAQRGFALPRAEKYG
jgi:hypothetical protein